MFILDTDILTLLQAGDNAVGRHKDRFQSSEVATTSITRIEILRGRFDFVLKAENGPRLLHAQDWFLRTEELLASFTIIPVDTTSAAEFDKLRQDKKLKKIGRADLLIACIALAHRAILVTRNTRHFRQVSGLTQENWAD